MQVEAIGDGGSPMKTLLGPDMLLQILNNLPLGTTGIRTDNHTVADVEVFPDPLKHTRLGIQVVDRNIEEALDLTSVQIHRDDMVAASSLKHIGHQLGGDRRTALVLLVLASIREVGNDSGDAASGGSLASVDHDQKLHQPVVDIVGSC